MPSLLDDLIKARDAVTDAEIDAAEPTNEMYRDDNWVGTANHKLRQLYTLVKQNMLKFQTAQAEIILLTDGKFRAKLREVWTIQFPQNALIHLFWASCYNDFPELLGKNNIDICDGWKVIWRE